jgi:hypothetical protein
LRKNFSRQGRATKNWLNISMLEGRRRRPRGRRRRPKRRLRRSPGGRRWWWPGGLMRVKALSMSELEGSSLSRMIQGLFRLLLAFVE